MGVSINGDTPIAGWFTMENAMNMDGLGVPLFQETSICIYAIPCVFLNIAIGTSWPMIYFDLP